MNTFLALPAERQNEIANTTMEIFAKLGYKKTSTSDIAAAIGVSKGMIFRYFGTKKEMYLYLVSFAGSLVVDTLKREFDPTLTDYFDRIMMMARLKINVLRQHPALLGFLSSVYFETDEDVASDLKSLLSQGASIRDGLVLSDADIVKFKETVDPQLVLQMLIKMSEGYASIAQVELDLDATLNEFSNCITMLRQNFYKEEYL